MASSRPWATTQPRRLLGLLVMNWEVTGNKTEMERKEEYCG